MEYPLHCITMYVVFGINYNTHVHSQFSTYVLPFFRVYKTLSLRNLCTTFRYVKRLKQSKESILLIFINKST